MTDMVAYIVDGVMLVTSGVVMAQGFNKTLEPRFNKYLNMLVLTIITGGVNILLTHSAFVQGLIPEYSDRMNIKAVLLIVLWCSFVIVFYKGKLRKKIQAYIVMQLLIAVSEIFLGSITSAFLGESAIDIQYGGIKERVAIVLMSFIEHIVSAVGTYYICKRKELKIPASTFATASGIILVACIMTGFIANSNVNNNDRASLILVVLSPLLLLALFGFLLKIMRSLSEKERIQQQLEMYENIKSIELSYETRLSEKAESIRRFRHDYRGNIETVRGLLNTGDKESLQKAGELLDGLAQRLEATKMKRYSDNAIINTVVSTKMEDAKSHGINIDVNVDVPKDLPTVEALDLNCIFVNLLNNAMEACLKTSNASDKSITLRAGVAAGFLTVKTVNPYTEIQKDASGKIKTTKTDKSNHGIGLSLIEDICKKYDGEFSFDAQNGLCTVVAGIKIQ